ncbi:MAG: sporulation domain protein [Gallionellaceae bacterium]|nr:MAG: sporulation domain protein [Gallionellaceae bacterium]
MYLEHFGLNEPPFKITPVTDFFFSGANRGEILDALVYAITDGEGIVKISGEVGSGKTMLCRMLLEKLPTNIKAIYLANPSLSRDELLYAIADRLSLDLEGQRVSVILQNLQNDLEAKYAKGERCVVLVDEAHAMPLDTLEELRLLYNLQVGKHKLLQIVLFGQPELDEKLSQSNMRQLKDRIVHHFTILPISQKVIHTYLMFRMRAAGYKGPDNFSASAEKLIGKASHGLMRRVNILADKALLAAFVENTHTITEHHVQAAIRDSEMTPMHKWGNRRNLAMVGGLTLFAAILAGAGWFMGREHQDTPPPPVASLATPSVVMVSPTVHVESAPLSTAAASALVLTESLSTTPSQTVGTPTTSASGKVANTSTPSNTAHNNSAPPEKSVASAALPAIPSNSLLKQRLDATNAMLSSTSKGSVSIQLFYTENAQADRMEGFFKRADKLGVLNEIYVLPIKLSGRDAYRVIYGVYPNSDAARNSIATLPQRYQEAFAPTLHLLDNSQKRP